MPLWFGVFVVCGCAWAADDSDNNASATPQIQPLTREEAEQERLRAALDNAPKAYEDHFLSSDDSASADASSAPADTGIPHSYLVELGAGFDQLDESGYGNRNATMFGLRTAYQASTLNYGDFLFQGDFRNRSGDPLLGGFGTYGYATQATSERIALSNIGLPLSAHTFADTTLGDTYSGITDALSRTYRLALGSDNVRGAATRIFGSDFDLNAGIGERGTLIGSPYPGFEKSVGSLGWLGYTEHFDNDRYAGVQVDRASGVGSYFDSVFSTDATMLPQTNLFDVTSWAAAAGYGPAQLTDGATRGRVILLGSHADPTSSALPPSTPSSTNAAQASGGAQGLFLEGSWRKGSFYNDFGAYAADPNLYFGDYQLTQGNRGAYWHLNSSGTRFSWGAGVDLDKSLPQIYGPTNTIEVASERVGVSGNFQYQFDRWSALGASVNVSENRYDNDDAAPADGSRGVYASIYYQTRFSDLPPSRFFLTVQRNDQLLVNSAPATGEELQWEQQWIRGKYETMQPEFTTTLGIARDDSGGIQRNYPTAGVQMRYWLDTDFSVTANLRYTAQNGGLETTHGLSGTLGVERGFAQQWHVGVEASLNQARASTVQNSLTAALLSSSNEKAVFAYVRFEGGGGSAFHLEGRAAGLPGGGRISGTVFYDANRDGVQQSDEHGVAGVDVVLDGRFRTRTDAQGHFEFALVSTGHHQLGLDADSVPLPWGPALDHVTGTDVPLRGEATARLSVVRISE